MVYRGPMNERVATLRPGRRPRMRAERVTPEPQACCLALSPVRRFGTKELAEVHAVDCPVPGFLAMLTVSN
jgi:hypothetical protein